MYFSFARVIPAVIVGLPFWFLLYDLNQIPQVEKILSSMVAVQWIGNVTVSVAFQSTWVMLIREIGKFYEEKYGKGHHDLPSVYMLMKSTVGFSVEFIEKLRKKVLNDFGMKLPKGDEGDQMAIADISKQVLGKVRYVKEMERHNRWYGFYRNLFSGSILGVVLGVIMIIVGWIKHQEYSIWLGAIFSLIYLALFMLKQKVIKSNGERFARQMYYSYVEAD